jgi:hypothetical protein
MHFLGIDTSTTSSKALLTEECGELLQWHHRRICFSFGKAGLKGEAIFTVGLTGQMHLCWLFDSPVSSLEI